MNPTEKLMNGLGPMLTIFGTMVAFYVVFRFAKGRKWPAPLSATLVIVLAAVAALYFGLSAIMR